MLLCKAILIAKLRVGLI